MHNLLWLFEVGIRAHESSNLCGFLSWGGGLQIDKFVVAFLIGDVHSKGRYSVAFGVEYME